MRSFTQRLIVFALVLMLGISTAAAQESTPDPAIEQARTTVDQLLNGGGAAIYEQFSADIKAALTADQFIASIDQLTQAAGAYTSEIAATVSDVQGIHLVTLTIAFENLVLDANIGFNAAGELAALNFRPNYTAAPPDAVAATLPDYLAPEGYLETETTINTGGEFELGCTLTVPTAENTDQAGYPALFILTGSGPSDRNGTLYGNTPYQDIARGIASRGVASLRCDDRALIYGAQVIPADGNFTVEQEYIEDALAAVDALRQTPGINPDRVFVLGHSLGGLIVPRVLARNPEIAGGIIASGAAETNLSEAALRQTEYLINVDGTVTPEEQQALEQTQQLVDMINALDETSDPTQIIFGAPPSYHLDMRAYDPVATMLAESQALLIFQGERDYQVSADIFQAWQTALADRADTTFIQYPALNHMLMAGEGAANNAEYQIPGHVDAQVIDDVSAWVLAH